MNTIKKCFDIILSGNKEESRFAARKVSKILYSATAIDEKSRQKHKDIDDIFKDPAGTYAKIEEEWRQENFVMAVSVIYFLHDREGEIDPLFPWLFQLLQHSNGYIRHAAVRMIRHELGPLTVYIRIPDYNRDRDDKLTSDKADHILYSLFVNLQELVQTTWQSKFLKYKYIDSLPPSSYKSVQMVLVELEDLAGKEYMDYLHRRYRQISNKTIGLA